MPSHVFVSYSHLDEPLRVDFAKHLSVLQSVGLVDVWHDGRISPGEDWRSAIEASMNEADLIVLLVTPDFLASPFCRDVELSRALLRWKDRKAQVVPVIVRPCLWQESSISQLQVLPKEGRAVTTSPNTDNAWTEVVSGIRDVLKSATKLPPLPPGPPSKWRTLYRIVVLLLTAAAIVAGILAFRILTKPLQPTHQTGTCPDDMVKLALQVRDPTVAEEGTIAPPVMFCLDAAPITADAYAACVAADDCTTAKTTDNCLSPSSTAAADGCITRGQMRAYCSSAGKRLPTQQELDLLNATSKDVLPTSLRTEGYRCARDIYGIKL